MERASALLRQAIALKPLPEMLNNLGRVYEEMGRYSEAIELYRRVVAHPKANPALRRLDATRIELLEPRLDLAWLAIDSTAPDLQVFVEGRVATWKPGKELGMSPGRRIVQITSADGGRAQVVFGEYEAGRRSAIAVTLEDRPKRVGCMRWTEVASTLTGFTVRGYALAGDVSALEAVCLLPGTYAVRGRQAERTPIREKVTVRAGRTIDWTDALLTAQAGLDVAGAEQDISSGRVGPLSALGAGALMAGVGIYLMASAESDRDEVNESVEESGLMTLSMAEATDLESSANEKGLLGSVLFGVGAAAALGGTAWLLLADEASEASASRWWIAPASGGVVFGGAF
jgi:hypothetical protein